MKLLRRNGKREPLVKPFENRLDFLKDELEDVFERAWRTFEFEPYLPTLKQYEPWPVFDLIEDEMGVTIEVDVPGFGPNELEVEVQEKVLIIRGTREFREELQERKEKLQLPQRYERHLTNFERKIVIPEYLDPEKVEAKYEKGMLTIRLFKLPGKTPKKVQIKTI